MKAFVIAAALAAFTSIAPAGAAREARPLDAGDPSTGSVIADAGRIGTEGLNALNSNAAAPWVPAERQASPDLEALAAQVDPGMLLVALGVAGLVLARPLGRLLRRHEQHRRAAALASTLGQPPRG